MEKALFWDFDGTLVHSDSMWSQSMYRLLLEEGYAAVLSQVRAHLRPAFPWYAPERDHRSWTGPLWWELLFRNFEPLYRELGMTEPAMAALNARLRAAILDVENYTVYPDAAAALARCRELGWRSYLLSNNYPELEDTLRALGLREWFDGVYVSALIGYDKPRPELFALAARGAGDPALRVMIGDNPQADAEGGRAAGMVTILAHSPAESPADYTVDALAEIPAILEGLPPLYTAGNPDKNRAFSL